MPPKCESQVSMSRSRSAGRTVVGDRAGVLRRTLPYVTVRLGWEQIVDDVAGVLELRRAGEGIFEDYVGDAGGCVLGQVGGLEVADLPPAEPPLLAQILEVVDLAAAFPIDIDGAQGFTAKDAGSKRAVGAGEDENGVALRMGARPGGKLGEIGSVETRVIRHAAQHGDGEESGDGDGGRTGGRTP